MRLLLSLCLATLLLPAAATAASIIDVGDVVVDAGNNLLIGANTFGQRTIDGADDGPYANVVVGTSYPQPTSLIVDNSGTLTADGDLSLGAGGTGLISIRNQSAVSADHLQVVGGASNLSVNIESGGLLHSNSAEITSDTLSNLFMTVGGPGSSWVNEGELRVRGPVTLSVVEGGYASHGSVSVNSDYDEAQLRVDGAGSRWDTGDLRLGTKATLAGGLVIENGGEMNSGEVTLTSQTGSIAVVEGEGSEWNIGGTLNLPGNGAGGASIVYVRNGGTLRSQSARLSNSTYRSSVSVEGNGSAWETGNVAFSGDYVEILVTDGGRLSTGAVDFTGCGRWDTSEGGCRIDVSGAASRWSADGPVVVSAQDRSPSTVRVADWATAVIREDLTIGSNSSLDLDRGRVFANQVSLDGGALNGSGIINGQVVNNGTVAVGDTGSGEIGSILIHGDYTQTSLGALEIQLGGKIPILEYDVLAVLGTSFLDGELRISLADDFRPEHGDSFIILASLGLFGEFASITGLDLGDGLSLQVSYTNRFVALSTFDENWIAPGVPEPTGAAVYLLGLGIVAAARRRAAAHQP